MESDIHIIKILLAFLIGLYLGKQIALLMKKFITDKLSQLTGLEISLCFLAVSAGIFALMLGVNILRAR